MMERGIDLVALAPPLASPAGKISKKDFGVNVEEGYARCPAGVVTRQMDKGNDGRGNSTGIPVSCGGMQAVFTRGQVHSQPGRETREIE